MNSDLGAIGLFFRELCRCMLQKRRLKAIALNKVRGFHAARQRFKTQSTGPRKKIQRAFARKGA